MLKEAFFAVILISLTIPALGDLKDPTMPPNWSSASETANIPSNITLNGIFSTNNQNYAYINGTLASEGSYIEGYEVMQIRPNVVYLRNMNGIFMVPLAPSIKTESGHSN